MNKEGIKNNLDLFIDWLHGAKVQYYCLVDNKWIDIGDPTWYKGNAYRIKPKEKELLGITEENIRQLARVMKATTGQIDYDEIWDLTEKVVKELKKPAKVKIKKKDLLKEINQLKEHLKFIEEKFCYDQGINSPEWRTFIVEEDSEGGF